jgi:hypothetical protein
MPIDYAKALFNISDDELERFIADWVASRMVAYAGGHERFSGSGDMGRDIVGYCTQRRFDAEWHNYQCKQLKKALGTPEFFCELGKIFFHSSAGAFPLPAKMFFVAPRGVVRTVRDRIAQPSTIGPALIALWDKYCAENIEDGQTHVLSQALRDVIGQYDFSVVELLDADKLVRFPEIKPVLVKWFEEDPGEYSTMPAPADVQDHEATYIAELLAAYSERSGTVLAAAADALAHPTHGRHLRDQRTRYFDASAFSRYYRDNTPPGTVEDLEQQIYHGVIDESRLITPNDALDRVDRILKHASTLNLNGRIGKYARITVKQGTCHHLVNAGDLRWKE